MTNTYPRTGQLISTAAWLLGVTMMIQAFRYLCGDIGAPIGLDWFMQHVMGYRSELFTGQQPEIVTLLRNGMFHLFGFLGYLFAAVVTSQSGQTLGRIVKIGYQPYVTERQKAARLDLLHRARERRRELRRVEQEQNKPESFGFGALLVAIFFGVMWLNTKGH